MTMSPPQREHLVAPVSCFQPMEFSSFKSFAGTPTAMAIKGLLPSWCLLLLHAQRRPVSSHKGLVNTTRGPARQLTPPSYSFFLTLLGPERGRSRPGLPLQPFHGK